MIIVKTPFRISLFGGGSDFPKYYLKNNGCVVGGTINKYCYVSARHLPSVFNYKHRIVWSKNETVNNINEIIHPTVKAVFKHLNIKKGIEMHYQGDLQKNSGLGTSSSFCVGLLNALYSLENKTLSSKRQAELAIHIEQIIMKENCGSQDQIWAAYGGLNFINFNKNNSFKVTKLDISKKNINDLNNNLILIYTGIHRFSDTVEKDKILKLDKNINHLDKMKEMAINFKNLLKYDDTLDYIGDMMNDYWELKKKLSPKVSNNTIDEIYNTALINGATGGKIIGSGGGGFLLMYCKKKFQLNLQKKLSKLSLINFKFVNQGSKVIFKG